MIKPGTIDFNALISNNTALPSSCQSKMIRILNSEFTEEENRWYIANLYVYMNYHPTNDYPINLDTLVKIVGFAHKKNAKRTLENNFIQGEDYKILVLPKEEQVKINGGAGLNKEEIMLNTDTFKGMCLLAKTEKSKQIRKYYVKLENIYNKIVKEEIEHKESLLQEKTKLLEEKNTEIKQIQYERTSDKKLEKHKVLLNMLKDKNCIYLIELSKNLIKIGSSFQIDKRRDAIQTVYGGDGIFFRCI